VLSLSFVDVNMMLLAYLFLDQVCTDFDGFHQTIECLLSDLSFFLPQHAKGYGPSQVELSPDLQYQSSTILLHCIVIIL